MSGHENLKHPSPYPLPASGERGILLFLRRRVGPCPTNYSKSSRNFHIANTLESGPIDIDQDNAPVLAYYSNHAGPFKQNPSTHCPRRFGAGRRFVAGGRGGAVCGGDAVLPDGHEQRLSKHDGSGPLKQPGLHGPQRRRLPDFQRRTPGGSSPRSRLYDGAGTTLQLARTSCFKPSPCTRPIRNGHPASPA